MVITKLLKKLFFLYLVLFSARIYCVLDEPKKITNYKSKGSRDISFRRNYRDEGPSLLKAFTAFSIGIMIGGGCARVVEVLARSNFSSRSNLLKKICRKNRGSFF